LVRIRRRGTAIVDTPAGILVVSLGGRNFLLPGGGAKRNESRQNAVIRELMEETGMKVVSADYLFEFAGPIHRGARGGLFRNAHKVFLVTATGVAKPGNEIKAIAYYNGAEPSLSYSARKIIEKYRRTAR
jgi:8-oxo-dGTP diphosphatase